MEDGMKRLDWHGHGFPFGDGALLLELFLKNFLSLHG